MGASAGANVCPSFRSPTRQMYARCRAYVSAALAQPMRCDAMRCGSAIIEPNRPAAGGGVVGGGAAARASCAPATAPRTRFPTVPEAGWVAWKGRLAPHQCTGDGPDSLDQTRLHVDRRQFPNSSTKTSTLTLS
eukprot:scaffold628_cov401-Prasinococcus_capsulatus_cf.AAC.12